MIRFKLEFDVENAAFSGVKANGDFNDSYTACDEISRILKEVVTDNLCEMPVNPGIGSAIRDINGNVIGDWEICT